MQWSLIGQKINLSGNVTFTSFQSSVNNSLNQKQGKNDPFDMNNARLNGQTVIEGGYIKASLINTRNLVVTDGARIGDFIINGGRLVNEGSSGNYFDPDGLLLSASGRLHIKNDRLRISMRSDTSQPFSIWMSNRITPADFLYFSHSEGAALRSFGITIKRGNGDADWYNRVFIMASHMPFKQNLNNVNLLPNVMGGGDYAVRYDGRTGCFYIE